MKYVICYNGSDWTSPQDSAHSEAPTTLNQQQKDAALPAPVGLSGEFSVCLRSSFPLFILKLTFVHSYFEKVILILFQMIHKLRK